VSEDSKVRGNINGIGDEWVESRENWRLFEDCTAFSIFEQMLFLSLICCIWKRKCQISGKVGYM